MRLILVRHGQTDWNAGQRFQGHSDVPLNEVGRRQAAALAARLSGRGIDAAYTSDLQRARETAEIICRYGGGVFAEGASDVRSDVRLREMNFGDWEGLTYHEIRERHLQSLAAWEKDVYKHAPPNGETLEQMTFRIRAVLNDLLAKYNGKTLLLVAHGGVLQILICLTLNVSPAMYWQFRVSPASLSEIAIHPAGASLNFLNDTNHLPGDPPQGGLGGGT